MLTEEQIKTIFESRGKHVWSPHIKHLKDMFKVIIPWEDRALIKGKYWFMSVSVGHSIDKPILDGYESFAVVVKEEYQKEIEDWRCDDRDTIAFELIDWGNGDCLLIASNNIILSSRWLNLINITEQEYKYMKESAWTFCPGKKCYSCNKDISKEARLNGSLVTCCPYCSRSFVE